MVALRGRVLRLALALATLVFLVAVRAAPAPAYVAMPIYSMSPPNGAHLALTPHESSTPVVIQSLPPEYFNMIAGVKLEVSPVDVLGFDGTLSDDFVFDYDFIQPSDTALGYYTTRFQNFRYNVPGTKYFQFSGYAIGSGFMASPVFSFVYEPPTAAPAPAAPAPSAPSPPSTAMSKSAAISDLRYLVKSRTHHKPRNLTTHCNATSAASYSCSASFAANGWGYGGHFDVRQYLGSDGAVHWAGTFTGHRSNGRQVKWSI